MKNILSTFLLIFLFSYFNAYSQQKVGVNKTNPNELLDVNGNVNIDGNLKLNGQAGQAGQILKTNSSGATQWVDFSQFEHVFEANYATSSNISFASSVTKIGIELQGGGGAGSSSGGGAGGNYIAFIREGLTSGTVDYTVGAGGTYNGEKNGSSSSVTINYSGSAVTFSAHGGYGALSIQRGASNNTLLNTRYVFSALGQPGTANDYSYSYGPGGNTIYKIIYGSGGGTYPSYIYTPGGSYIKNQTSNTDLHITESTYPFTLGSGGAANKTINSLCNGNDGYVRIYY